jgi:hypothetical protein
MKLINDLDDEVIRYTYAIYSNYDFTSPGDQPGGVVYNHQEGGLIPDVFTEYGVFPNQEGSGIGSILSSIGRWFKPLFFSGLKSVGKQALKTAGAFAGDLVEGADWRTAGEHRLREAGGELVRKLGKRTASMAGMGYGDDYGMGYGEGYGMSQFGGGNKSVHSAVKLYSFAPPAALRGSPTTRKRKRSAASSHRRPAKRRRVQRKRSGAPAKRRRKQTARRSTKKKKQKGRPSKRGKKKKRKGAGQSGGYSEFPYPPF